MKLNIANPTRGLQKTLTINKISELKFYDKKVHDLFEGSLISPEYTGFTFKITGGNDFQGVPMNYKFNTTKMVRPLLKKGDMGYRCIRAGSRKRKCVRGGIVSAEISVLNCTVVVESETVIEGLNDKVIEQSHLPKRADKWRKMFDIPENVDLYEAVKNIIKTGDDFKMPKLKITRLNMKERAMKLEENKEKRRINKETVAKEREVYNRKFQIRA